MAPSPFNNSDEMCSQRARSKSDADIDYSSQGKSAAFISIMLIMFHAVIRRVLAILSMLPTVKPLFAYDASSSWNTRCL
jgi:hypothetical protein